MSENKDHLKLKIAGLEEQIKQAQAHLKSLQDAKYDSLWDLRMLEMQDHPLGDEWLFHDDEKFWM